MHRKLIAFGLAAWPLTVWGQKPVISPGGMVNAASYSTSYTSTGSHTIGDGSIAIIFGTNLAASTLTANTVPLPISLGSTSVSVYGIAAPLFYVSPTQINFQMPSPGDNTPGTSTVSGIVVTTAGGASDPYPLGGADSPLGIFTLDGSGCGRAAISNVGSDGSTSLNSPANSISPGGYLSVYGTGIGIVAFSPGYLPDGYPTPSSPLTYGFGAGASYDFVGDGTPALWEGRAPGLIGVDQFNVHVPETAREGCAVPFQVATADGISQPVTIAVRNGGGPCVDPPTAGYGQITWEKAVSATAANVAMQTETATVSLQASPGMQAPATPVFAEGGTLPNSLVDFGASCPIPGYRSLRAGTVTVQCPGFGPATASVAPLRQGQVSGLTVYQAALPAGTIQSGNFTVAATGGADVGGFQSGVRIGSDIRITTSLAGIVFPCNQPVTINWTGGDSNAWVTVRQIEGTDAASGPISTLQARASDGTITIPHLPYRGGDFPPSSCGGGNTAIKLIIEVDPDPSQTPVFSAAGLSLGGKHLWRYTYSFDATLEEW